MSYSSSGKLSGGTLVVCDLDLLSDFFSLKDSTTGERLDFDVPGVFICLRASEVMELRPGDSLMVYDDMMKPYEVAIAGVFDNYFGREMFMSEESYRVVFGEEAKQNAYLIRGENAPSLAEEFSEMPGFVGFSDINESRQAAMIYVSILNVVAVLLTVCAGVMAYFILLNLINMYISQRKRELTIMRVNGFTVREVKQYVASESIATTSLGLILGVVGGILFSRHIISQVETPTACFIRSIRWPAVIIAVVITVVFTVAIYMVALRKVKDLKLTDVA